MAEGPRWPADPAPAAGALLAQGISLLIFADERRLALRAAGRDEVLGRTATIARLLAETPPALHEAVLDAASTRRLRFWLAAESAVDRAEDRHHSNRLARRLSSLLEDGNAPVLVDIRGWSGFWEWDDDWFRSMGRRWSEARGDDDDDERVEQDDHHRWHARDRQDRKRPLSLVVAVGLDNGRWLNAETLIPPASRGWAAPSLLAMAVMAMLVCAVTILVVRRIPRPLARLATAAEAFGRGEATPPLDEAGP